MSTYVWSQPFVLNPWLTHNSFWELFFTTNFSVSGRLYTLYQPHVFEISSVHTWEIRLLLVVTCLPKCYKRIIQYRRKNISAFLHQVFVVTVTSLRSAVCKFSGSFLVIICNFSSRFHVNPCKLSGRPYIYLHMLSGIFHVNCFQTPRRFHVCLTNYRKWIYI